MTYNKKIDKLISFLSDDIEFILFGIGRNYELFKNCLKDKLKVSYCVDNEFSLQGQKIDGLEIKNPNELMNKLPEQKILILSGSVCAIKNQLDLMGFKNHEDYCYVREIIPLFYWTNERKLFLTDTSFLITFNCTLKCKNCSLKIPYISKTQHRDIVSLKQDIDLYFKYVDFVYNFKIMGGEPTMSPYLEEILLYIGKNYRKKIFTIKVVTNATIPLSDAILNVLKQNNMTIEINDYSDFVNYKVSIGDYIEALQKNNIDFISYRTTMNDKWVDFGDPNIINHELETDIQNHFSMCAYYSRGLCFSKLYFCTINAALANLKIIDDNENDYLDLTLNISKEEMFLFEMGMLKLGYTTLCPNCNGDYDLNKILLPAGEQI
ncbi:MAG: radical SAM protein [Acetobacterium woodii]|nr:radical SAM protein [Acetobacterium woodii]